MIFIKVSSYHVKPVIELILNKWFINFQKSNFQRSDIRKKSLLNLLINFTITIPLATFIL